MEAKRLFFGFQITAPWPKLADGRKIAEDTRHLTVGFLGNIVVTELNKNLSNIPLPSFRVGFSGYFDQCLFLPEKHPHVVSWHASFMQRETCEAYAVELAAWIEGLGLPVDLKLPWLPHVTIARSPFNSKAWRKIFTFTPFYSPALHLYESLPGLEYKPIWSYPFVSPFEEIEHTADRAFIVRGETVETLYYNASIALAFHYPPLLNFKQPPPDSADGIVRALNTLLAKTDATYGCPFKAVSYHGDIEKVENFYQWEMIVDV